MRIQLGHFGGPCISPAPAHKSFIVLDVSGFISVNIDYCNCGDFVPHHIQLLRARLFPASKERPRTAFTFDVLEYYHELSLQGKLTAYDFYHAMIRRTDNSKPQRIVSCSIGISKYINIVFQYRYDDFLIVMRLWRHLTMLKRAGRCHSPTGASGTCEGELVVQCPACPHPGRNLPQGWDTLPLEERQVLNRYYVIGLVIHVLINFTRWKYTLFVSLDGNFRLWAKEKGIRDVELSPGWSYYVENSRYSAVLNTIPKASIVGPILK